MQTVDFRLKALIRQSITGRDPKAMERACALLREKEQASKPAVVLSGAMRIPD